MKHGHHSLNEIKQSDRVQITSLADLKRRLEKAERTLRRAGYTDNGGELWKPPLGKMPNFDLIDRYRDQVETVERMASMYANAAYKTWLMLEEAKRTIRLYAKVILETSDPCLSCSYNETFESHQGCQKCMTDLGYDYGISWKFDEKKFTTNRGLDE